jgi:hypothetical protein
VNFLDLLGARAKVGRSSRLQGQGFSGVTGTMAAGLTSGSAVFAARYPAAATGRFHVSWLHLHYTCLANFTTVNTAGRRLHLRRSTGTPSANPAGGTAIDVVPDVSSSSETLLVGQIATTAALTMTGITLDTAARCRLLVSQAGLAGQDYDELWQLEGYSVGPGEVFALGAGATFDAGGTWQLGVKGYGVEMAQ